MDHFEQLEDRAFATPRMTAVRLDGEPVTFGALVERLGAYDRVLADYHLSEDAAMSATLMSFLPGRVRAGDPLMQAKWISAAAAWLTRDSGRAETPLYHAV